MYENLNMYLLLNKTDLPGFVDDALNHLAIPFATIRNKDVIAKIVSKTDTQGEPVYMPAEVVLTFNYKNNEFIRS